MSYLEPKAEVLWTSAFFNERFPDPVSPLGWSIIQELVEETALREPLRFVGYRPGPEWQLTRLWHGRPFVDVRVFQVLYKHFPAGLLPEDARRYFPRGDTSLRYNVDRPTRGEFYRAALRTFCSEPGWSPLNYRAWEKFVPEYEKAVAEEREAIQSERPSPPTPLPERERGDSLQRWLASVERLMDLSRRLLRLHRWSLTYAEICYTLLRKLVSAWISADRAGELCATLVGGVPDKSTESDAWLWQVAYVAHSASTETLSLLTGPAPSAQLLARLADRSDARPFLAAFNAFLAGYGHRSRSLDIFHPPLADDPSSTLDLVRDLIRDAKTQNPLTLREARRRASQAATRTCRIRLLLRRPIFDALLALTQRYIRLREDQRFYWQMALHAQRHALLKIGEEFGLREMIFFLTLDEVRMLVRGDLPLETAQRQAATRRREFEQQAGTPYPAFLQGDIPLDEAGIAVDRKSVPTPAVPAELGGVESGFPVKLHGIGASPGLVRGRARLVAGLNELTSLLGQVSRETILVAPSTDPGWTPLFMKIGGLITERGGQLSHAAVVAREYGLPAVVGVAGARARIENGQLLEVDGQNGVVCLLDEGARGSSEELSIPSSLPEFPRLF